MTNDPYIASGSDGEYRILGPNNLIVVEALETLGEAKMWARRLNEAYASGLKACLDRTREALR